MLLSLGLFNWPIQKWGRKLKKGTRSDPDVTDENQLVCEGDSILGFEIQNFGPTFTPKYDL